jgi:NADH-ubiquinone oxidoreductase chain 5
MYLVIITLPLLAAISSGLLGRKLGVTGAQLITSGSVIITCFLSLVAFYEVGIAISPVSVKLFSWIDSESLTIDWGFNFDALTVSMLIPVLIVSALVHVYSIGYMSEDPHQQRFFSYLSMFTFFMLVLVTGDNYLVMFIGWEGVGISSYLLVSFWFTRVQANKSAISALLFNRVGDMFLTIGLFALIFTLGNIDYAIVFSIAPFLNENLITIIGICFLIGAMAKSAQIGLHVWLPQAMEGGLEYRNYYITSNESVVDSSENNLGMISKTKRPLKKVILSIDKIPATLLDAMVGDLLGDGHISRGNYK